MDTIASVGAPELNLSSLLVLVSIALTIVAWGAWEVVWRHQAERERRAVVIERLRSYRVSFLAAEVAAQPLVLVLPEQTAVEHRLIGIPYAEPREPVAVRGRVGVRADRAALARPRPAMVLSR